MPVPTPVPDRAPTFDPTTQRWHWWSTPGQTVTFAQDQARAEPIEVAWEVHDMPEGRIWIAVTPELPGFTPFLWAFGRKVLWLRRPEGVWTFPLPKGLKRKDRVLVQEPCEGLPHQMNRRCPIECLQAANTNGWHPDGMDVTVTLDEHDQDVMGKRPLLVDGVPTIMGGLTKNAYSPVPSYDPVVVEMFSRHGPMRFSHGPATVSGERYNVLVIVLPNGTPVAHLRGPITETPFKIKGRFAVLGDNRWMPYHVQPIILDDDSEQCPDDSRAHQDHRSR